MARSPKSEKGGAATPKLQLEVDHRLVELFGSAVPSEEVRTWAGMPEPQRAKAVQRMKALDRYCATDSELSAAAAAADAGVELGRFYQMARKWKKRRSLDSLGAYASATKPRQKMKPEVANALQAVVKKVVADRKKGESLTSLAKRLGTESGLAKPPALNTLRLFIEREQRRVRSATLAGTEVLFDLAASSLMREDARPHVVFLVIDRGTDLILGHAEGLAEDSSGGYREAAANSLRRLPRLASSGRIWSESMSRSEIVPGLDKDAINAMSAEIKACLGGIAPQPTGEDKAGAYMRRHLGLNLGTVRLIPPRTFALPDVEGHARDTRGLTADEAYARVELAVADHNAALLANLNLDGAHEPPADLVRVLESMATV